MLWVSSLPRLITLDFLLITINNRRKRHLSLIVCHPDHHFEFDDHRCPSLFEITLLSSVSLIVLFTVIYLTIHRYHVMRDKTACHVIRLT